MGAVTWSVVLTGAVMTIGVALFYNTVSARAHYWLWGEFSVAPHPFMEIREYIQRWETEKA